MSFKRSVVSFFFFVLLSFRFFFVCWCLGISLVDAIPISSYSRPHVHFSLCVSKHACLLISKCMYFIFVYIQVASPICTAGLLVAELHDDCASCRCVERERTRKRESKRSVHLHLYGWKCTYISLYAFLCMGLFFRMCFFFFIRLFGTARRGLFGLCAFQLGRLIGSLRQEQTSRRRRREVLIFFAFAAFVCLQGRAVTRIDFSD